jgi:glycosyltransferase involved in cell wall biosynthesis
MIAPCFSGGGMRMKIIEAMALSKPVITTTIGAEGLVAENGVHLMIADDSQTFANCVETLMKSPEICQKMGQNAYVLVNERYNNSDLAVALAEFYKQHLK